MSFETPLPPYSASDPYATYLSASCLDFLLIEMVPMAYRLPAEIAALRQGQGDSSAKKPLEDEEKREAALHRLESLGHRVGQGLAESFTLFARRALFSKDRPRFADTLDVIKFLCKDLWTLVFRKQIDNLKTNHRGVYVLTDNSFRPFSRMSLASPSEAVAQAQPVRADDMLPARDCSWI
ncbi:MAG: hypothetical protein LQ351_002368 [Letrouitia transgressa]|nr:MAG: hypothetical protein LQ351_002368 [Letrouitia transgressa]